MAAEAGAELSRLEFTATFAIAPAHTTMVCAVAYAFAVFRLGDEFGPDRQGGGGQMGGKSQDVRKPLAAAGAREVRPARGGQAIHLAAARASRQGDAML